MNQNEAIILANSLNITGQCAKNKHDNKEVFVILNPEIRRIKEGVFEVWINFEKRELESKGFFEEHQKFLSLSYMDLINNFDITKC